MRKLTASSSLTDVAFAVCTALERAGFVAVLTGGSAATVHAPDAYLSRDLDFVLTLRGQHGDDALAALGFRRKGNVYLHAEIPFSLEFPPGPLGIGDDLVTTWVTLRRGDEVLHVLTPEDSCRDRLASWLFWADLNGLTQALGVHLAHEDRVSLERLRSWAQREGQRQRFSLYEQRFAAGSTR